MSIVLITGCSTGIERALARHCAESGDTVYATMRDVAKAGDLVELAGLTVLHLDVTDEGSVRRAVDDALRSSGRIDVVVNNAGVSTGGPVEDVTFGEFTRSIETHLYGPLHVTRAVLPAMRAQRSGTVVMVSSFLAASSAYIAASYVAGKRALEGAAECLQLEVARWGIRVVVVRPGYVDTPIETKPGVNPPLPEGSAYQILSDALWQTYEGEVSEGASADKTAREIRDAYLNGDAFYVPVGDDSRADIQSRRRLTEREYFATVPAATGIEWWEKGEPPPSAK